MTHVVIFLTGSKGSGKTTVFNMIKGCNPEVVEIQLAKKLKDVCAKVFKIDREKFDNPDTKEVPFEDPIVLDIFSLERIVEEYQLTPKLKEIAIHQGTKVFTPRHLLQYIGTDVLRALCSSIHCLWASKDIRLQIKDAQGSMMFVVTDGRFEDEFNFFQKEFKFAFYPFYIKNDKAEETASADKHPSETEVFKVRERCIPLENNGNMTVLHNNVIIALEDVYMDSTFPGSVFSNYPCTGVDEEQNDD